MVVIQAIICADYYVTSFVSVAIIFSDQYEYISACGLHNDALPRGEEVFLITYFKSKVVYEEFYLALYIVGKYGYVFDFHDKFTVIVGYWYRKTQYQQVRNVLTGNGEIN